MSEWIYRQLFELSSIDSEAMKKITTMTHVISEIVLS